MKVHTYAASFGEDLAGKLIKRYTSEGDTVLDPFMGAGTAIIQARSLKRNAVGIDVDPIACLIVRTIIAKYKKGDIERIKEYLGNKLNDIEAKLETINLDDKNLGPGSRFSVDGFTCTVPENLKIQYWFAPVQRAILSALTCAANDAGNSGQGDIIRLAISSAIIRKWPNTLSLARDIDHSRPHKTAREDLTVKQQLTIFKKVWKTVIGNIEYKDMEGEQGSKVRAIEGNAGVELETIEKESIDYVVTSPPYFNAIDYPRAHRYSQWWLWPEKVPAGRGIYIGLKAGGQIKENEYEEKCRRIIPKKLVKLVWLKKIDKNKYTSLCRYIWDLNTVVSGLREVLGKGKSLTFVLANNKINGKQIPICGITKELLKINGFTEVMMRGRKIDANRRRYPYGIAGFKGLLEKEYLIHARRPA